MDSSMSSRVNVLKKGAPDRGRYVLYWMQASQRGVQNHALSFALEMADELMLPLVVFFGITGKYPGANLRHFRFMFEGLAETEKTLRERGIKAVFRLVSPESGALKMAEDSALVVTDAGYTRIGREWRKFVADRIHCPFYQVESDVVVPVETLSAKEEYSARTIRPKIWEKADYFMNLPPDESPRKSSTGMDLEGIDVSKIDELSEQIDMDRTVSSSTFFRGGYSQASGLLKDFIENKLDSYHEDKNNPVLDGLSHLSPYIHFGQISPVEVALRVMKHGGSGADAFLEELIVRRELAINHVHHNSLYDSYQGLPPWCRRTLEEHRWDRREYVYSLKQLERAETHDSYWNAAQKEAVLTGKMHGYMRMYWGKKILEWSESPETAFRTALYLNDRYELDGRDPNGYTGVAWCFGMHDRPWATRPVFGSVRYMNDKGLRRKFPADEYVRKIDCLEEELKSGKGKSVYNR